MWCYFAAIFFVVATGCNVAGASENDQHSAFYAVIQHALEIHPDLRIERSRVQAGKARVDEARGTLLPSLNVFGTEQKVKAYDDFSGIITTAQYGGATIPISVLKYTPKYQVNYGIELNYNLYSGGADQARIDEMSAAEQAARAQLDVAKKRVIVEVTESYWGLRKAQIAIQVARRKLDYAKEQLAVARKQLEQGEIAKIDFDARNISVETSAIELRASIRSFGEYQRRYASLLGENVPQAIELQQADGEAKNIDVDALLSKLGMMQQPEVQKMQADFMAAQSKIKQVHAEYLPVLDVFLRSTYIGRSDGDIGLAQSNSSRDVTAVGVQIKWNLFDGYRSDSRAAQAAAMSEQLRLQTDKTRDELGINQQELLAHEEDIRDQLLLGNKQFEFAKSKLQIAQKQIENQQISALELHAAQLACANANSKVQELEIDLLVQRIKSKLD